MFRSGKGERKRGERYVIRFELRFSFWMQGILNVTVVIGGGGRGHGHRLFGFAGFGLHCVGGGVGSGGVVS